MKKNLYLVENGDVMELSAERALIMQRQENYGENGVVVAASNHENALKVATAYDNSSIKAADLRHPFNIGKAVTLSKHGGVLSYVDIK